METTIDHGAWVRVRNARFEGGFEYGQIDKHFNDPELGVITVWEIGPMPPPGTVVHKAVWKGEQLQSRGTFIYDGR